MSKHKKATHFFKQNSYVKLEQAFVLKRNGRKLKHFYNSVFKEDMCYETFKKIRTKIKNKETVSWNFIKLFYCKLIRNSDFIDKILLVADDSLSLEEQIHKQMYLKGISLRELGEKLNISHEHVRNAICMEKVRTQIYDILGIKK